MLDDAIDDTVLEYAWMIARQICKTTSFTIQNGYFIDQDPAPILLVYPTLDDAKTYMKDKLVPFIEATPRLRGKILQHKSRQPGNTILNKRFPGGNISACGSNSPSSLRQRTKRVVLCDEIDSMRPNAEGDPIAQADGRAETFHNAVKGKSSTPTIKGLSRIERLFDKSDKQYWFCPCPHCGLFQTLKWSQVKFTFKAGEGPADGWWEHGPKGPRYEGPRVEAETFYQDTGSTVYVCESAECGAWWTDADRIEAICRGEWRGTAPFKGVRGRHLSGLYRLLGKKKAFQSYLHEFAEGFLEAKRGGRFTLIVWTNTFLAETWEEVATRLDSHVLEQRREAYTVDALPNEVLVLTAGIDVQQDRLEVEIKGWGRGYESWGVVYRVLPGNPFQPAVYRELDELLLNFEARTADGRRLKVAAVGIDTGFATDHVCAFARPRFSRRVFAMKGSSIPGKPLIGGVSSANRRKCRIYSIGTDTAKSEIYGNLRLEQPGPGYFHWPSAPECNFDARYFAGLTAEEMTVAYKKGFPMRAWLLPDGRWNEPLDITVYNRAAVAVLQPSWDHLEQMAGEARAALAQSSGRAHPAAESHAQTETTTETTPPNRRPPPMRRGGFIKGWR